MSDERAMIERAVEREGVNVVEWRDGDDGLEAVLGGTWGVVEDDEHRGLYAGDEGTVTVCVVGSVKYGNQRAYFSFTPEGYDGGNEVQPFEDVEPL